MENSKKGYTPMMEKPDYRKSQGDKTPTKVQRMQTIPYALAIDMVLMYGAKPEDELKVSCYVDKSFQNDKDDTKSQTGYVCVLNGRVVDWKSAKQSTTAMSSTKAKYIAAAEASMEAVWMRKFIYGLGGVMPSNKRPIEMICDKEPTLAIAKDPAILKGARHFQRKYHYIREVIQRGEIILKKVHTDDNVADSFTKPMPFNKDFEHAIGIGIVHASSLMIDPSKNSRVDNVMPNKPVKASVRTNSITVLQPHVISQENVNPNSSDISSTGVEITAKTRRPQPRSNTKNYKVPSASKSSCIKNKDAEVEEHHRNLLLSKNKKQMSSECNTVKLAIRNDKSEVVYAMCSNIANQKKHRPKVRKPKKLGSKEKLASPKPSKPRICLRCSPTGRIFDLKGKIIAFSESECQFDSSKGDNACTPYPKEPPSKRFPNPTFTLADHSNMFMVCRLGMLKTYDRKSEASYKFHLEVSRNCPLWK
ncbi:hypothetical protein Tco_0479243 [Tanacetum coccineum]